MAVFLNLLFETEPFAAILIAHGTLGLSQIFVKFQANDSVVFLHHCTLDKFTYFTNTN